MITIRFFNTVVTISSTNEEKAKKIVYDSNSDWVAKARKKVVAMSDDERKSKKHPLGIDYDLLNTASTLCVVDEDICRKKDWYTNDTKKMKLIDVIKREIYI